MFYLNHNRLCIELSKFISALHGAPSSILFYSFFSLVHSFFSVLYHFSCYVPFYIYIPESNLFLTVQSLLIVNY